MLLFMRTAWPGLVTCNRARGVLVVGVARLYPPARRVHGAEKWEFAVRIWWILA